MFPISTLYMLLQCKGGKYKVRAASGKGALRPAQEEDLEYITTAEAERERVDRERADRERTDRERTDQHTAEWAARYAARGFRPVKDHAERTREEAVTSVERVREPGAQPCGLGRSPNARGTWVRRGLGSKRS